MSNSASPPAKRLSHNPLFVIASDRRERGNPTRKVVARAKPVAISRVPSPLQADRDKASVAALPRNDIMTQPQGEDTGKSKNAPTTKYACPRVSLSGSRQIASL